jgi:NAD(P)-dependent dehydrogenase (short-subunit alcohol dehydrogenase family)
VKQMSAKGLTVVLTARNRQRGLDAISKLRSQHGLSSENVVFHPLDVCSSDSVSKFSDWINERFRGLDILVSVAQKMLF